MTQKHTIATPMVPNGTTLFLEEGMCWIALMKGAFSQEG